MSRATGGFILIDEATPGHGRRGHGRAHRSGAGAGPREPRGTGGLTQGHGRQRSAAGPSPAHRRPAADRARREPYHRSRDRRAVVAAQRTRRSARSSRSLEDRDRRADGPTHATAATRERRHASRDLAYQAEYCYSASFSTCSTFLALGRPQCRRAGLRDRRGTCCLGLGHRRARGSDRRRSDGEPLRVGYPETDAEPIQPGGPVIDGDLFGPADPDEAHAGAGTDEHDWVSASAWAAHPDPPGRGRGRGARGPGRRGRRDRGRGGRRAGRAGRHGRGD